MQLVVVIAVLHIGQPVVCENKDLIVISLQLGQDYLVNALLSDCPKDLLVAFPPQHKADVINQHVTPYLNLQRTAHPVRYHQIAFVYLVH